MTLTRMNQLLVVVVLAAFVALGGCNAQAKRAKESVDQKLKPFGVKDTEMGVFVTDPAAPDRAYISVIATWNFANSSGQPQKENLGFILKRDGEGWHVDKMGIKYTADKNTALTLLQRGKPGATPPGG